MLTLSKVTDADEGLYMCKSLIPIRMQLIYQVRVISKSIREGEMSIEATLTIACCSKS
jgi:hypothetical protein